MKNFRIKRRMRNRLICAVLTGCLLTGMTGTADLRLAYASSAKEIQDKAKQDLNNTNQQIQNIQNQQNLYKTNLQTCPLLYYQIHKNNYPKTHHKSLEHNYIPQFYMAIYKHCDYNMTIL